METCQQKTEFPSVYPNQEKSTALAPGLQINKGELASLGFKHCVNP